MNLLDRLHANHHPYDRMVRSEASLVCTSVCRGGSRNSLRGGGSGSEFFEGGGGFRVQVRGNFHILTSKKKQQPLKGGGLNPLNPPSGSATGL